MLELLVTMSVAAILMYMGIPSFVTTIRNDRLVGQANDLLASLNYARSEAANFNGNVTVCASSDGASCGGSNWANGWIICQDAAGKTDCSGSSTILRATPALSGSNTLTDSPSTYSIVFGGTGSVSAAENFSICDVRGYQFGRAVYLFANGMARASPTIGQYLGGTAITC